MKVTNWNYGPFTPLAPVTVYEPPAMARKSPVLGPDGEHIVQDFADPVVGFRPAPEHNAEVMDGEEDGHPTYGEPVDEEDYCDVFCPEHGYVRAKRVCLEPPPPEEE